MHNQFDCLGLTYERCPRCNTLTAFIGYGEAANPNEHRQALQQIGFSMNLPTFLILLGNGEYTTPVVQLHPEAREALMTRDHFDTELEQAHQAHRCPAEH